MLKHLLFIFILIIPSQVGAQSKKFWNTGSAELTQVVEKLPFHYQNDLPFIEVKIKGKIYNFLFDSGAPTVISNAIYNELGLKISFESEVGDSQKSVQKQIFTVLPELSLGNIVFKNISAVVVDLTPPEFKCLQVDGIIGSNQMAILYWKINYLENSMLASKDLQSLINDDTFSKIPFKSNKQKTPFIKSKIENKDISMELDTGSSGKLQINSSEFAIEKNFSKDRYLISSGINSIGLYGPANVKDEYTFKINKFSLAELEFENKIFETGDLNLIGNKFLKDFEFILDWKKNNLYLKPIQQSETGYKSFGFSYRFIKNKAVISSIIKDKNIPLEMNDEILSINGVSLENLDHEQSCNYYLNRVEKNLSKITVVIKRGEAIKTFDVEKITYF